MGPLPAVRSSTQPISALDALQEVIMGRLAFALLLSGTFCAAAIDPASGMGSQCFSPEEVTGWAVAGPHVVYVHVSTGRVFKFDLHPSCTVKTGSYALFSLSSRSGDLICAPVDAKLTFDQIGAVEPCLVKKITSISK